MSNFDNNNKQQPGPEPEQLQIDMPWEDAVKRGLEAPPLKGSEQQAETEDSKDSNDEPTAPERES